MSLGFAPAIRTARLTLIEAGMDAGSAGGIVSLYTTPRPATPGDAITTQTKLADITAADPFGSISGDTLTVTETANCHVLADGTANWFRGKDSTGAFVMDGNCGVQGSGADLELDNLVLVQGGLVRITGGTIAEPV